MQAIRSMRDRFPDSIIVADMKVADTGTLEVEMAAKAGANIVCILADADDSVIAESVGLHALWSPDYGGFNQCKGSHKTCP